MPMFSDPQEGNKALMKNIAKLATTMGEIGGAVLGGSLFGPMGGAIGAELGGGGVRALGGGQSALSPGTASALGYLHGESEEEKKKRMQQAGQAREAGGRTGKSAADILMGYSGIPGAVRPSPPRR